MALIRWQPFREMEALQRDMNRMFESLASTEQGSMQQAFMPLAEMKETEDAVHLKIEVPGMNAEDLDVQVTKEAVTIAGERKTESKSEQNGMTRSEFRYGRFSRTIPLSTKIDNNSVKGDYQNGILTLELPKLKQEENRVTKVQIGSGSKSDRSLQQSDASAVETKTEAEKAVNSDPNEQTSDRDMWQDPESAQANSSESQATS